MKKKKKLPKRNLKKKQRKRKWRSQLKRRLRRRAIVSLSKKFLITIIHVLFKTMLFDCT